MEIRNDDGALKPRPRDNMQKFFYIDPAAEIEPGNSDMETPRKQVTRSRTSSEGWFATILDVIAKCLIPGQSAVTTGSIKNMKRFFI